MRGQQCFRKHGNASFKVLVLRCKTWVREELRLHQRRVARLTSGYGILQCSSAGQHVTSVCRAHVWHLPGPPQWTGAELPGRTQLLPALPREGAVEQSQVPDVPRASDAPSCQEPSARGADRSPTCPLPVVQQPADQGHLGCSPGPVQQPPCLVCGPLCLEGHPGIAGHTQEYLCPVPGGPGGAGADRRSEGAVQRRVYAPAGAAEDSCAGDPAWHSGKLHASPGSSTSKQEETEQAICIHAGCQHRCDTQQEQEQEQEQENYLQQQKQKQKQKQKPGHKPPGADLDLTSTLHLVASVQPDLNEMLLSPDVINEQR